MTNLVNRITGVENDIVREALSAILSHRIKFTEKGERESVLSIIDDFLAAYPHIHESRETHFICRLAYQKLINAAIVLEVENLRRNEN